MSENADSTGRPETAKRPPETVEEMLAAITAATAPSGVDWFLGPWPASEPVAQAVNVQGREAAAFHARFAGVRPRLLKDDPWESAGNWLNETITNSPTIADRATRDRYWDGARKAIAAQREQIVEMARAVGDFRARYDVQDSFTDRGLREVESRIQARLRAAQATEPQYRAFTAVAGMVAGSVLVGGVGMAFIGGRAAITEVTTKVVVGIAATVGLPVGAAAGWSVGGALHSWASGAAQLTEDLTRLRALREQRGYLGREGVRLKTLEGVIDILEKVHGEFRIETDPERRRWIMRVAERRLERLTRESEKGASPWAAGVATVAAAIAGRDPARVGQGLAGLCEAGNVVRREIEAASALRIGHLVGGWAVGRIADPLTEPEDVWL